MPSPYPIFPGYGPERRKQPAGYTSPGQPGYPYRAPGQQVDPYHAPGQQVDPYHAPGQQVDPYHAPGQVDPYWTSSFGQQLRNMFGNNASQATQPTMGNQSRMFLPAGTQVVGVPLGSPQARKNVLATMGQSPTFGKELFNQYNGKENAGQALFNQNGGLFDTYGPQPYRTATQDEWTRRNNAFQQIRPEYQDYVQSAAMSPNQPHWNGSTWQMSAGPYYPSAIWSPSTQSKQEAAFTGTLPSLGSGASAAGAGAASQYYGGGGGGGGYAASVNGWFDKMMSWTVEQPGAHGG